MSDISLELRLERQPANFAPGDVVEGVLTVRCETSWEPRHVDVLLAWRTSGKGDENSDAGALLRLAADGGAWPPQVQKRFSLRLPDMPWSYHGTLIKLDWIAGAYARPNRGKEVSLEVPIFVHPTLSAPAGVRHIGGLHDGQPLEVPLWPPPPSST